MEPRPAPGRAAFGALAAALYAAATALLLWPLLRDARHLVAGADGSGDAHLFLWNLWWVRQSAGGGFAGVEGQSLLHTRMMFWPDGVSLAWHTLAPVPGLLSLPVQWAIPGLEGLAVGLAALTALSFVLTGLAVLLLARQAGASRWAALGAGLVGLLQPYRLHHLNHLNLLSIQFGLFTLWWLVRVLRRGRLRDAAGLALLAALTTGTDLEGAVHVALGAALLVAWDLGAAWRAGTLASRRPALLALGAGAALALLLHLPLLLALGAAGPVVAPPAGAAAFLSANLRGLLVPGAQSLLFAPFRASPYAPFAGRGLQGDEVFLGVLFVGALAGLLLRGRRGAGAWLFTGGGLLLLALGPTLHAGALDAARDAMPWAWLGRLAPPLSLSRAPVRLVHLGGLALAVGLAVLATARPAPAGQGPARRRLAAAGWGALFLLLALERWPATPFPLERVEVPEVYRRLAAEPGAFALLESPDGSYVHWMRYLSWQTVHGKPLVLGYVSRRPAGAGRFQARLAAARGEERAELLREAGVRYLVLHPEDPAALGQEPRVVPLGLPPAAR